MSGFKNVKIVKGLTKCGTLYLKVGNTAELIRVAFSRREEGWASHLAHDDVLYMSVIGIRGVMGVGDCYCILRHDCVKLLLMLTPENGLSTRRTPSSNFKTTNYLFTDYLACSY